MRTKYLVHGQHMSIISNGAGTWYGRWTDTAGNRRHWPMGSQDPRPFLDKIEMPRRRTTAWGTLSCSGVGRQLLREIASATGEKHAQVIARLSIAEEQRLTEKHEPEPGGPGLRVDPNASIKARWDTVECIERCARATKEHVGHLVTRLIVQDWQRLLRTSNVYGNTTDTIEAIAETSVSLNQQEIERC